MAAAASAAISRQHQWRKASTGGQLISQASAAAAKYQTAISGAAHRNGARQPHQSAGGVAAQQSMAAISVMAASAAWRISAKWRNVMAYRRNRK